MQELVYLMTLTRDAYKIRNILADNRKHPYFNFFWSEGWAPARERRDKFERATPAMWTGALEG